jgi:hypothetical protein
MTNLFLIFLVLLVQLIVDYMNKGMWFSIANTIFVKKYIIISGNRISNIGNGLTSYIVLLNIAKDKTIILYVGKLYLYFQITYPIRGNGCIYNF